ncbi:hypothetical protein ISN45_Aa06g031860 [Arabidopsis thaliana x Arabidopsis arenosa]|uniref:Transmembrane protein n=1 Tax=Arabidopsis thaliana x Arabidopsis arenosa TaxID=1240361 RepID=A0A8T1Z3Y6_9BRAS|nr:hypothetical protein ISN45_Aa06g031860 [Arabidopsis thaliana x Arabidopsis arenosa]
MDYGMLYQMRRRYSMARMCPRGAGRADGDDSVAAATHNACSDASLLLTKLALARPTSDNVSVVVLWLIVITYQVTLFQYLVCILVFHFDPNLDLIKLLRIHVIYYKRLCLIKKM